MPNNKGWSWEVRVTPILKLNTENKETGLLNRTDFETDEEFKNYIYDIAKKGMDKIARGRQNMTRVELVNEIDAFITKVMRTYYTCDIIVEPIPEKSTQPTNISHESIR